jgi:hypothetical protein
VVKLRYLYSTASQARVSYIQFEDFLLTHIWRVFCRPPWQILHDIFRRFFYYCIRSQQIPSFAAKSGYRVPVRYQYSSLQNVVWLPDCKRDRCCAGQAYGPTFTTGDVIGCGLNLVDGSCFYTKNGHHLGIAFTGIPRDTRLPYFRGDGSCFHTKNPLKND